MKKLLTVMICVLLFGLLAVSPCFAKDLININTATAEQLTELPGIGPAISAKIVEHRQTQPFATIEQILDVKGIGPAKFEAIKGLITVGEPAAPAATKKE